jgi:hypothetical protein
MIQKPQPSPKFLKSYRNEEFLISPAARNIRILCEMTEPAHKLRVNKIHNTVVFFGSARALPLTEAKKQYDLLSKRKTKTTASEAELKRAESALKLSKYYEDARLLSQKLTQWFNKATTPDNRFYVCSGGGPGIMEAANRGAKETQGKSLGLNISLPFEQSANPYQTKEISFEFHYFFIRKFWFFYLAKALVVFPGGFGTFDELFELLTLIQTQKTKKHMPVVLYGSEYWNRLINFDFMVESGVIAKQDLNLFQIFSDVDKAFDYLKKEITKHHFKKNH